MSQPANGISVGSAVTAQPCVQHTDKQTTLRATSATLPAPGQRGRPQSATTIGHSGAVPTVHQDNYGKARIPLHSTSHLELAAKNSSGQ